MTSYVGTMAQAQRAMRRLRERDARPTDAAGGGMTHRQAVDAVEREVAWARRQDPTLDRDAALVRVFIDDPRLGEDYAAAAANRPRTWSHVEDRARAIARERGIDVERALDVLLREDPDAVRLYREHFGR
jgi:hypothetical protein